MTLAMKVSIGYEMGNFDLYRAGAGVVPE
jgi:hypothetical protein